MHYTKFRTNKVIYTMLTKSELNDCTMRLETNPEKSANEISKLLSLKYKLWVEKGRSLSNSNQDAPVFEMIGKIITITNPKFKNWKIIPKKSGKEGGFVLESPDGKIRYYAKHTRNINQDYICSKLVAHLGVKMPEPILLTDCGVPILLTYDLNREYKNSKDKTKKNQYSTFEDIFPHISIEKDFYFNRVEKLNKSPNEEIQKKINEEWEQLLQLSEKLKEDKKARVSLAKIFLLATLLGMNDFGTHGGNIGIMETTVDNEKLIKFGLVDFSIINTNLRNINTARAYGNAMCDFRNKKTCFPGLQEEINKGAVLSKQSINLTLQIHKLEDTLSELNKNDEKTEEIETLETQLSEMYILRNQLNQQSKLVEAEFIQKAQALYLQQLKQEESIFQAVEFHTESINPALRYLYDQVLTEDDFKKALDELTNPKKRVITQTTSNQLILKQARFDSDKQRQTVFEVLEEAEKDLNQTFNENDNISELQDFINTYKDNFDYFSKTKLGQKKTVSPTIGRKPPTFTR